ncbi:hypothetical protein EYF80_018578 [Liparis tanakae]|uniref:Uncharacterized protein n=1 Tax=Liparis tanakae TaxID=230148 RepID=A0A4Z2I0A6_9TELE|nr:hypothetical protein EYF80_018578 [Liparis tanakae]
MGGINQLVKLPVSNHRGAPRRAGPGRGSFSPVHQRPHEARGFIPRPHGPPVLPNRLRRTVSIGAVCGLVNTGAQTRGSDRGPLHPGDKEAQHFAVVQMYLYVHVEPTRLIRHMIVGVTQSKGANIGDVESDRPPRSTGAPDTTSHTVANPSVMDRPLSHANYDK